MKNNIDKLKVVSSKPEIVDEVQDLFHRTYGTDFYFDRAADCYRRYNGGTLYINEMLNVASMMESEDSPVSQAHSVIINKLNELLNYHRGSRIYSASEIGSGCKSRVRDSDVLVSRMHGSRVATPNLMELANREFARAHLKELVKRAYRAM